VDVHPKEAWRSFAKADISSLAELMEAPADSSADDLRELLQAYTEQQRARLASRLFTPVNADEYGLWSHQLPSMILQGVVAALPDEVLELVEQTRETGLFFDVFVRMNMKTGECVAFGRIVIGAEMFHVKIAQWAPSGTPLSNPESIRLERSLSVADAHRQAASSSRRAAVFIGLVVVLLLIAVIVRVTS